MPIDCQRSTSGGKGNAGKFIERDPKICAAGIPSAQPDDHVADSLQHYLLKDEVDCLISDTIFPPPPPKPLPPLRKPIPKDKRNAGLNVDVANLLQPPIKSKFLTLVDDLKDSSYASFWKKPVGRGADNAPMLPEGIDVLNTTFGRTTLPSDSAYDIAMPKNPLPDKTPPSKWPSAQINRNYCRPPFDADLTYGYRTNVDKRGTYARCCMTDDRIVTGRAEHCVLNAVQANYTEVNQPRRGRVLTPNDNLKDVPEGYTFGIIKRPDNLPECLSIYKINPDRSLLKTCLKHLNTLRKNLSSRFLPSFFRTFYLNLRYFDKEKIGWLPKNNVYDHCATKLIRFDNTFIEPLLSLWNAFDGTKIEYKMFVHILNYREELPNLPKILDFEPGCLDFHTTYTEMVKPGQEIDSNRRAGLPSGRYFDKDYATTPYMCCKAHRILLPEELGMKSCICPSILTQLSVSHRDMYQKREPNIVRRVFEAAGQKFTDESFQAMWEKAQTYHSQGWVCYETFRRALEGNSKE